MNILCTVASTQGFYDLSDKTRKRFGTTQIETILRVLSYDLPLSVRILLVYRTGMNPYGVSTHLLVYQRLTKTRKGLSQRAIKNQVDGHTSRYTGVG